MAVEIQAITCSEIASLELDKTTFNCRDNLGDNLVTLTVTDACGNVSTCTANVRIEKFDLALRTILAPGEDDRFYPGENVTFKIEVHNQGTIDATDINVVNYIPNGLSLADADWSPSGDDATITIPSLLAGEMTMVEITLVIDQDARDQIVNRAEIHSANAADGFTNVDVDSQADSIEGNDTGGEVNSSNDDEIDEGCCSIDGDDEDDEDPEDR